MELQLVFTGRIPSKKNSKRIFKGKNGRPFITSSANYKAWEKEHVDGLAFYSGKFRWKVVKIDILFTAGDKRRWDLTNKAEGILDTLVLAKVIDDDNTKVVPELRLRSNNSQWLWEAIVTITSLETNYYEKDITAFQ